LNCNHADYTEAIIKDLAAIAFGGWRVRGDGSRAACRQSRHSRFNQGELQLHGFYGFHGSLLGIDSAAHQRRTAWGTRGEIISPGVPTILS